MRGIAVLAFILAVGGMLWYSQKDRGAEPKCQFCDKIAKFENVSWTGETIYLCHEHAKTYRSGRTPKPLDNQLKK